MRKMNSEDVIVIEVVMISGELATVTRLRRAVLVYLYECIIDCMN